jgi:hypothetical protein
MTVTQQLDCNAKQILSCLRGMTDAQKQSYLMAVLVAQMAIYTGMSISCAALAAAAQTYACIPRQDQLAALLYLVANIQTGGGGVGAVLTGLGNPSATPSITPAVYFDTTNPSEPNMWLYANGAWTEIIG